MENVYLFKTMCTKFYHNWPSFVEDTTMKSLLTSFWDTAYTYTAQYHSFPAAGQLKIIQIH